jgi:hypothetical protein
MRFNEATHEGLILLASDSRKGIWAAQEIFKRGKTVRHGGQLPAEASAHTLELMALCSALSSVTCAQATFLVQSIKPATTTCITSTKPRVLVVTADSTFAESLRAMLRSDRATLATKPLKAGRNFLTMAARQLGRFELTLINDNDTGDDDDKSIEVLRNWAKQRLLAPASIPHVIFPTAVSQVF